MLFSVLSTPVANPDLGSTEAIITCVLAYTYGLEGCRIEVVVAHGTVTLTGSAPSLEAAEMAVGIAADLSSRPVVSEIAIVSAPPSC